jgi:hypothetical protein
VNDGQLAANPLLVMFRKEFLILCSLAAGVLLIAAAAGFWVGHTLTGDADKIALDTLPGLVDAGTAMALTQDNWHRVHLLLIAQSAVEQTALITQIRTNSNEGIWRDYSQGIYDPGERQKFRELLAVRSGFLQLREEYFALVQTGHPAEAKIFLEQNLAPEYQSYHEITKELFEYNAQAGRNRAADIIRISRTTPPVLAACCLVVFAFGWIVGLRGAFAGLKLASRNPKK